MKLLKLRCDLCDFIWFEPFKSEKRGRSIDHGCPQGCDYPGRVAGKIRIPDCRIEWICWLMIKEDIDSVARTVGLDPKKLTPKNYQDIARMFIRSLHRENRHWRYILEDAIETMVRW